MNRETSTVSANLRRERRYGYIYLVNLIIPIAFLSQFPLRQVLVGAGLITVFAGVYLYTFRARRWKFTMVALQILIMMFLISYLNVGYIWMIFYPAACIAILFERRYVLMMVVSMTGVLIAENYVLSLFHRYAVVDWLLIMAAIVAGIVTCYGTIWQTQTMRSREQLRKANLEIERLTKVAERERISRDMHDVMGHELSMITLKSQLVAKLMDRDPVRAKLEIRDIEEAARQALTRVREYIAGMRQPDLFEEWDDAIKLLGAAGIACDVETSLTESAMSEQAVQALAMCLREATTNLVRHSGATNCQLRLQQNEATLCLSICDNGKGVVPTFKHVNNGGNGINGMRARISSAGGWLTLWSNGELTGVANTVCSNPSPWSRGVALRIEVPCQTVEQTMGEVHG